MGMFDSVYAKCPSCGEYIEFQSKAGECDLNKHHVSSVPPVVACDIDGNTEQCGKCFNKVTISAALPERVVCTLSPTHNEDNNEEWD